MDLYTYLFNVMCTLICLSIIRIFIVYQRIHIKKKVILRFRLSAKLMIVLGSGGHTFEILHLIRNIREKIRPRVYVLADTDILSEQKARTFEDSKKSSMYPDLFVIEKIPRSREVNQSWFTTIFTTLKACISAFQVVFKHMPDAPFKDFSNSTEPPPLLEKKKFLSLYCCINMLPESHLPPQYSKILCNGPGTCVPVCIAAVLIHLIGLKHITIIFVESICRVKTLSLTGKILYYIADHYFVHWPELKDKYPRAEYIGKLI